MGRVLRDAKGDPKMPVHSESAVNDRCGTGQDQESGSLPECCAGSEYKNGVAGCMAGKGQRYTENRATGVAGSIRTDGTRPTSITVRSIEGRKGSGTQSIEGGQMRLRKTNPDSDILRTQAILGKFGQGRIRGWIWSYQMTGWFWAQNRDGEWYRSTEKVRHGK